MKSKAFITMTVLAIASFTTPSIASQTSNTSNSIAQAQAEPSARQVLDACVQNRAETLPNPFTDVPTNHWAFKAVLTMHYCGAYRQATPPSLIERLTNQPPSNQSSLPVQ